MHARRMHKHRASGVAAVPVGAEDAAMETARDVISEVARPLGACAATVIGFSFWLSVVAMWCLLVFLLTGRLPWMVRKYF